MLWSDGLPQEFSDSYQLGLLRGTVEYFVVNRRSKKSDLCAVLQRLEWFRRAEYVSIAVEGSYVAERRTTR